jgi:hypothetical protein
LLQYCLRLQTARKNETIVGRPIREVGELDF